LSFGVVLSNLLITGSKEFIKEKEKKAAMSPIASEDIVMTKTIELKKLLLIHDKTVQQMNQLGNHLFS
jgi:hypothetical protein